MNQKFSIEKSANLSQDLTHDLLDFFVKKFDGVPEVTVICALQFSIIELLNEIKKGRSLREVVLMWNSGMINLLEGYERENL